MANSQLVQNSFVDYQFMVTMDWRGQGIQNDDDNKRVIKGYHCYHNYHLIKGWIHSVLNTPQGWIHSVLNTPHHCCILAEPTWSHVFPYSLCIYDMTILTIYSYFPSIAQRNTNAKLWSIIFLYLLPLSIYYFPLSLILFLCRYKIELK